MATQMTEEEQLQQWLVAKPVHNEEKNLCCPDYSCCNPKLLAPIHEREKYVGAVQNKLDDVWKEMQKKFINRYFDAHPVKRRI